MTFTPEEEAFFDEGREHDAREEAMRAAADAKREFIDAAKAFGPLWFRLGALAPFVNFHNDVERKLISNLIWTGAGLVMPDAKENAPVAPPSSTSARTADDPRGQND